MFADNVPANTIQEEGVAQQELSAEKMKLIKNICAKDCTDNEFQLLMHLAKTYGLDPLARQIWAVKYPGSPAQIFCGRDGLLVIAHRSGHFDGIDSGVRKDEEGKLIGWAKVHRKDMSRPFSIEVYEEEYNTKKALWKTKPRTMIQKVAEAQALRRAFTVTGLYTPEEIPEGMDDLHSADDPNTCSVCGNLVEANLQEKIQAETGGKPMCRACFNKWWEDKQNADDVQKDFKAEVKPKESKSSGVTTDTASGKTTTEKTNLTKQKCETCGNLITKSEMETSQFQLGRFMCKSCMAQLREEQRRRVEESKKGNVPEKAAEKTEPVPEKEKPADAVPAEKQSDDTGLVCAECGAEVAPNVASMAKMFAGKILCNSCLAEWKKRGGQ